MGVLYARVGGAWVPVSGGGGGSDEVVIAPTDPIVSFPSTELWVDTSAPGGSGLWLPIAGGTMNPGPLWVSNGTTLNTQLSSGGIGAYTDTASTAVAPLRVTGTPVQIRDDAGSYLGFLNILGMKISYYAGWETGVQSSLMYQRAGSTGGHIWYRGGSHSDTAYDPGSGGSELMRLVGTGLEIGRGINGSRPLSLYGTTDNLSCYIGFYDGGGALARKGWMGYSAADTQQFRNENANAAQSFYTNGTGPIIWYPGGAEEMRLLAGGLCVGKTAVSTIMTRGCELQDGGIGSFTTDAAASYPLWCAHISAADANSVRYQTFRRTGNAELGSITQNSTTGVTYNTTSDYRLKRVIGPVEAPAERVAALRPVRFAWRETDEQQDGFMAHEVADVVPDAVTGDKDAVDDEGQIIPQQLDASRLVPLLTAALQQALAELDALKARVAALEAPA